MFTSLKNAVMQQQWLVNAINRSSIVVHGVKDAYTDPEKAKLFSQVAPYSMLNYARLNNVYKLAEEAERTGLPGAFVECGVWNGGCSAIMASIAARHGKHRKTWLFDSFEGLPQPTAIDGELAKAYAEQQAAGTLESIQRCVGSLEKVEELLYTKLSLAKEDICIRKGWFQDSLPPAKNEIGPIAVLRLDGDWYESTMVCLEHLFPLVVPGGYVIFDDYGTWEGCRKAAEDYFKAKGLDLPIRKIDHTGVYIQVPRTM